MKYAKKISVVIIMALILSSLSVFTVSAITPTYWFTAPKLALPVELGKVNPVESWDDAGVLVVNSENAVFKEFGRWQGADDNDKPGPDRLSVTYRIKWDETYLYIREERFDTSYHHTDDTALTPWNGDGTLFIFAYDDGDPKWANCWQPFWVNKGSDGKTHVALRCWKDDSYGVFDDPEDIGNWKYAGTQDAANNMYITEVAVPWAQLQAYTPGMPSVTEGTKFRFGPVVPNVSTDDLFGEDWNQINFHDRFGRDDADLEENGNPAELPANWAGFLLGAVSYVAPAPEPEPEAPVAAPEAPAAPAPTSPTTGDQTVMFVFAALIICAASAAIFKVRRRYN